MKIHIRKNAPPTGGHVFHATGTTFELFHDDRTINVASRVLTRKNATPPWQPYIIWTNLLTKFHEDWTINVASRVFTRFNYSHSHIRKNAPPLGSHVFQANANLPTKFHEDWTINVASTVLTRKTAPPPGRHVFSLIWTIFELVRDINETNVLTKNTAPPPGGHTNFLTKLHKDWPLNVTSTVFTSFELSRGINGTNVLTKFHEDQTINVASRVFTRQNVDDRRPTTDNEQKAITKAHHEHVVLR
ncbi:hypothetical protein DPMN_159919 [Dreissena polymorpha]|uniref:Uncharacterized protein n=1 Tax=Dreissena polymorpha TaxID=45954 RepID=A0A9D4EMI5_DREPO|nr:hypothetical protein DPMN_159919 [Dreissena polymorpha]